MGSQLCQRCHGDAVSASWVEVGASHHHPQTEGMSGIGNNYYYDKHAEYMYIGKGRQPMCITDLGQESGCMDPDIRFVS